MTTLTYQMREFVRGSSKTFEVWQCHTVKRAWRTEHVWEKLSELPTFEAAESFISEKAGGFYRNVHDYDQNGKSIIYAW